MAGNAVVRSVLGGTLPLAGAAMYKKLGANWAGTLLGLLEVAIIPIPFIFYRYGHKIREKSSLIREMREIEERQEEKKRKVEAKIKRRAAKSQAVPQIHVFSEKEVEAEAELCRVKGITSTQKQEV